MRTPPIPGNDLKRWAQELYEYMIGISPFNEKVEPVAPLLAHRTGQRLERAGTPGLLLYDPIYKTPVYADGTEWLPLGGLMSELAYTTAFNVDGAALAAGANAVALNVEQFNGSSWMTVNLTNGQMTFLEGSYRFTGSVTVASTSGTGAHAATAYLAEISDLTTPVGNVIAGTAYLAAGNNDVNVEVPFSGELTVPPGGGTYSLVVRTSSASLRLGKAHGISGLTNYLGRVSIALLNTP